ncbi:MAG: hypothetical protein WA197_06895, partial [Candidatus Acidiferrales bacterium]
GVRLSYKMPYAGNHLTLRNVSPYSTERLIIAAPPTVQVSGSGIAPAGQDQGFNVYTRDNVAANSPIDVSVSGTAPPPQSSSNGAAGAGGGPDNSQNPSVNSRASDGGGAEAQSVSATTIPARLDGLKWILTGGFASIFVLGFAYLWLKPRPAVASNGSEEFAAAVPQPRSAKKSAARSASYAAVAEPPASSSARAQASESVAAIDHEVRGSLDELKDSIFRLELRRQAGTISEEDYARQRESVEKMLRGLVRG